MNYHSGSKGRVGRRRAARNRAIIEKFLINVVAIAGLICLGGCSLFHHKDKPYRPRPMQTHFDRPPENTVEPRFNEVSPTTDY